MVKAAGTPDAIEQFKALVNPERYRQQAEQHKDELVARGEQLLLQVELTENDPLIAEKDKELVLRQLNDSLQQILWRVGEINDIVASHNLGQAAGLNRKLRRQMLKQAKKVPSFKVVPRSDKIDDDAEALGDAELSWLEDEETSPEEDE